MSIKVKMEKDIAVLTIKGKLMGGDETRDVHEKVKEILEAGSKKMVIDLSKVKWLNSTGLGTLMACLTSVTNAGGQLKICGADEKVKSVFMITKLMTVFEHYSSQDEAVSSFK